MMTTLLSFLSFAMIFIIFIFFIFLLFGWRWLIKKIVQKTAKIVFTDSYQENLLELLPGFRHMGLQNVLENNLRAESGDLLHRPLGGASKKWPHLDSITFIPAQTDPFPTDGETNVDVKVTIGPNAKKPLHLAKPFLISGMGYGISVSDKVRMALMKAANETGIAINSGEGGILPEEVQEAKKFVLQFSKTEWGKEQETLEQAAMIEIKLGQGAVMGMGGRISPQNLTGKARQVMSIKENEQAVIYEHFYENQTIDDLKQLVDELREVTDGVPIGAKIAAGGKIEEDIDHLLEMGVDVIAVDGGQGATVGAPPILADDFGIPTLHGVVRASRHLEKRQVKDKVSLIVSGGLFTPGHFLKVLALGADAVYIGSAILFTVSHNQILHALPFEPPTQIVWDEGKYNNQFDEKQGADAAKKFLDASTEEIREALRAMGKRSLQELSTKDLVSHDPFTAEMIGIPFSFATMETNKEKKKTSSTDKKRTTLSRSALRKRK